MKLLKKNFSGCSKSPVTFFPLKFLFFLLLTTLFSNLGQESHCAQVSLTWDPNSESDLAGYKIYSGIQPGNYQNNIDVGNVTTYTLNDLDLGVIYYIAATAYNTQGLESGFSNELAYTVPSCSYVLSPSSASFSASGGSGGVNVATQSGCNWGTSASSLLDNGNLGFRHWQWDDELHSLFQYGTTVRPALLSPGMCSR